MAPQGLQIVGVNMDDGGKQDVEKFVAENSINYPILLGQEKVAKEYGGIDYLPTTFYIDRNGVVTGPCLRPTRPRRNRAEHQARHRLHHRAALLERAPRSAEDQRKSARLEP